MAGTKSKPSPRDPEWELRRRRRGSMIRQSERRGMLLEMRAQPSGTGGTTFVFEGYGATFDEPFDMWDPWGDPYTEVVRPGAFTRSLDRPDLDVPFLLGHNEQGIPFARTTNGTMKLSQDSRGLAVWAELDGGRSDVRDLARAVDRGDLGEMSIGFVTRGQEWSPDYETRSMLDLDMHRGDVSPVALGANAGTAGSRIMTLSAGRRTEKRAPTVPYTAHPGEVNECPQCHSVNDDTAKFCDQCGTGMRPVSHVSNMAGVEDMSQACSCGNWNSTDAKFCGQCGQNITGEGYGSGYWSSGRPKEGRAQAEVTDLSTHADFNVAGTGVGSVKCPYTVKNGCGAMNSGSNKFCGSCGGPLYDSDGQIVLDDSGVTEEVGASGDADLLSRRLRLLELA